VGGKTGDRSIVAQGIARYYGDVKAVDGVDLSIGSGQIFGFLGPNGSGKTTLVKVFATILAPTAGTARVAGFDVVEDQQEVRSRIGVALQEVGLDPLMTAREMLVLQSRLFTTSAVDAQATAERLLVTVGLADVDRKKRVGQYSGGMKRRLDLALALVNDPDVLFLDEPTTGLDPVSRLAIWEEVRRLNEDLGMTIFLTTQYLEEADKLANEQAPRWRYWRPSDSYRDENCCATSRRPPGNWRAWCGLWMRPGYRSRASRSTSRPSTTSS
jgi:ABC-2 type transport system ATP-binding protein